jgi:hypothetical protein
MTPNFFADFMLVAWIPLCLVFYRLFTPVTAATISLIGTIIVLPSNYAVHFQGIPEIDRHVSGAVGAFAGYVLFVPRNRLSPLRLGWDTVLLAVLASSSLFSAIMNPDALRYGDVTLPALSAGGSIGLILVRGLEIVTPFYMASRLIRSSKDVLDVLRTTVVFGLAYVPLILWEARMSPQLHATVYGYFPHDFAEHIRAGMFRPVVFAGSGLECGLFMASAMISAVGLHQAKVRVFGLPTILPLILLFVGVAACLSLAPLLYATTAPLLLLATSRAMQARVGTAIAAIVLLYPLLRSQDLFPTSALVSASEYVSGDRANSLKFRFDNEDDLLAKASQRPLFGWGGWGRNKVYDPETGEDFSITDGAWIIELGQYGLTGFLSYFLLLLVPTFLVLRRSDRLPTGPPRALVTCLVLVLLVRTVDLIPNGFTTPYTMFLAGSLMPFTRLRRPASVRGRARVASPAAPAAEVTALP